MKKYIYIAIASLLAFAACDKEARVQETVAPEEEAPVKEQVTISVSMPDEGLTKVTLTQDGTDKKLIKLAWESTDVLDINGETFTVKDGSISVDGKTAEFTGTTPTPDGSGKYTISYADLPGTFTEQTQSADGNTDHLGYAVSISGANAYSGITFSAAGASAVGGTLSQSSVLRLRALLPAAVASAVQKVIFKASANVFAGSNTLTVNLASAGTAGSDNTLDVYATLPAGDVTLDADMDLLIQFQVSANDYDKYTAYRQFANGTAFIISGNTQYLGISCSNIESFANASSTGIGESANPYLIGDQHQMQAIAGFLESGETRYFKLIDNIDLTGVAWTSVNSASPFDKAIDLEGNGKTVSNLNNSLIYDLNGSVKNLSVSNASITSTSKNFGVLARQISVGGVVRE